MSFSNKATWYRQVIMDHYRNPKNKGLIDSDQYQGRRHMNPSCGDTVYVQLLLEGDRLLDIRHDGEGCSICCASASVMSIVLRKKNRLEAIQHINAFKNMITGQAFDEVLVDEAIVFEGVAQVPARIKCATLAWIALEELLLQSGKE